MKKLLFILFFLVLIGGLLVWRMHSDLNRHLGKLHEGMPYSAVKRILPQRIVSRDLEGSTVHLMNGTEVRLFHMTLSAGSQTAVLTFDSATNLAVFPQKVRVSAMTGAFAEDATPPELEITSSSAENNNPLPLDSVL